jgi:hypothetical protein
MLDAAVIRATGCVPVGLYLDLVASGDLDDAGLAARIGSCVDRYRPQVEAVNEALSGGEELLPLLAAGAGVAVGALLGSRSQPQPKGSGNEMVRIGGSWADDPWWATVVRTCCPLPVRGDELAVPLPVHPIDEVLAAAVPEVLAGLGSEAAPPPAAQDLAAIVDAAASSSGDELLPAIAFLGGVIAGSAAVRGNTSASVNVSLSGGRGFSSKGPVRAL